ncbi:lysylphosphatidylglycerol synthase transmembrane domain-containing protein [Legionella londiniensis]|uniref:Integral membrane protein n=1 Tax=Legionella londiniensis TaxID=45068 RepID=A0A0W0VNC8_9GAMM|nr:lysylphosphatidylglycerol synthase transmembrane domain-containing protein [Legionella londiniensis]KTD21583.1 hypothetical protein Llon_0748 [Legionella londiniensis]STX93533.1 Uncharacterised protein family (UPF0104) [Legionella londiniensis]
MKKISFVVLFLVASIFYLYTHNLNTSKAVLSCLIPFFLISVVHGIRLNFYSNNQIGFYTAIKGHSLAALSTLFLPGRVSELLKPWYFNKTKNMQYVDGFSIVIVERTCDVLALLLFSGLLIIFKFSEYGDYSNHLNRFLIIFIISLLFSFFLYKCISIRFFLKKIPVKKLRKYIIIIFRALQNTIKNGFSFWPIFLTIFAWLSSWFTYWLFFYIYPGQSLTLIEALTVFLIATIGHAITITPGGIGTFEGGITAILTHYSFSPSEALIISFSLRLIGLLPNIAIFLLIFLFEKEKIKEIGTIKQITQSI